MKEKVVLAYSGGLDTSYCVKYLSEELGLEVYTALANTGGFTEAELKTVEKKAYALGAKEHVNLDVTEDYYLYHKLERLPATAVFLFSPNPDPDKSVKQRKIQRYENL
jgi:argininosuccinate synthase